MLDEGECIEAGCGWWDEEGKACAVLTIGKRISSIEAVIIQYGEIIQMAIRTR